MGNRSNTTAERRHVPPLVDLHLWRVCHFSNSTISVIMGGHRCGGISGVFDYSLTILFGFPISDSCIHECSGIRVVAGGWKSLIFMIQIRKPR